MLELVKRKNSPYWIARGTIDGRRIEKSTQCRNKTHAKQVLENIKQEAEADIIFGTLTFAQASALYITDKPAPLYFKKILNEFGSKKAYLIKNADMRFAANKLFPKLQPASIKRHFYTPVRAIINNAADEDLCPPARFKAPQGDRVRTYFFTPEQVSELIPRLASPSHPMLPALVTLLLGQGLRSGEAFALLASDVSLENKYAMIRDPKNGIERSITLIPKVVAALSTLHTINSSGRLFTKADGAPYPTRKECDHGGIIKKPFEQAVKDINLNPKNYTPHVCRHTWATWFYAQTKDSIRLKDQGGWQSNLWMRYTKLGNPALADNVKNHGWDFKELGETRGTKTQSSMKSI